MTLQQLADLMGRRVEELRRLPPEELPPPVMAPLGAPVEVQAGSMRFVLGQAREWDFETVCKWSASSEFRQSWAEWCRVQAKRRPRGRL